MLVELSVENVAIIERAQIGLGPAFTVITGETGAGKSLLIDAIELALGVRADSGLVRTGANRASVSAAFDLTRHPDLIERCRDLAIDLEDGVLYIQRDITAEGRSQCRLGGKLAPVASLRQVGRLLVDLHGQHDHQSLLDPARHVGFLDDWIGPGASSLLESVATAHRLASESRRKLEALRDGLRHREQRLDLLRYQVEEIETAAPRPGELEELEAQLSKLKNADRLATGIAAGLEALQEADDRVRTSLQNLDPLLPFDDALEPPLQLLRTALVEVEESARDLAAYLESLESNPEHLESVAGRLDLLRRLRRKYGEDEAAILVYLDSIRAELELLDAAEENEGRFEAAVAEAERELAAQALALSALRKERASEFSTLVQTQLHDLAMDRARFEIEFRPKEPDASGADDVEFAFSANPGEPPRSLSRIASGGEISRVMLAIKSVLADRAQVPTLIFDEIDAGLGGKAAATVARKLEELGRHCQVVAISHLPQIAARAQAHFRIEKGEREGRVTTELRPLPNPERVEELARMLAGETITESALANAREMLARA